MAELADKIIGGFKVVEDIRAGAGSQGAVHKAVCIEDVHHIVPVGTVVALKVMIVQDDDKGQWRKLQKRTAELMRMNHPNVVKYLGCFAESGAFNDIHVVVQEFLEGETLKERLERFPSGLDVDEGLRIVGDAVSGLVYTTSRCKIVHRDIKPGNIFVCIGADGSVSGVKLIDFEIAKQDGGTVTASVGNIRGSFDYMAPDFTDPGFHGDEQSDVFSMGVVLHETLTGHTPYQRLEGDSKKANFAFLARWASVGEGDGPIRISSRVRRLLAHADEVLNKSLDASRDGRYQDFSQFKAGLDGIRFRNLKNGNDTYQLLQFIGKGGFGEVFKARVKQTGRLVAVKHLLRAEYAARFNREAKIMRKLDDPCFVHFVDFFTLDSGGSQEAFLVMAFLPGMPGSSLRDAIRKSKDSAPLDMRSVLVAFERYAKGLKAMHNHGIYHRDIKPSNLYYPPGRPELAAIMDLGIARDVHGSVTSGQVPGTLDYMPPEVVTTDNRGDEGMDIYALGLCLYEALTRKTAYPRLPSGTTGYTEFFERARSMQPPSFADEGLAADGELLTLLRQMTNPDASARIRDAADVAARLHRISRLRFGDAGDISAPYSAIEDGEGETLAPTVAMDAATSATLATQMAGIDKNAIDRERRRIKDGRNASRGKKVAAVIAAVLLLCAVGAGIWRFQTARGVSLHPDSAAASPSAATPTAAPSTSAADPAREALERRLKELEDERKRMEEEKRRAEEDARKIREAAEKAEREREAAEQARKDKEEADRKAREEEMKRLAEEKVRAEEEARKIREAAEKAERERKAAEQARKDKEEADRKAREAELERKAAELKRLEEARRKREAAEKAERERAAAERARAEKAAGEIVERARLYFDSQSYSEVIKLFCDAKQTGYAITDGDMAMIEKAYAYRKRELELLIKRSKAMLSQGRALIRPLKAIEDELAQLIDRYSELKSSR